MIVINLFGAPGAGKSTGAARIFSNLKAAGINAELVTEFAKDKVWEESKAVFQDQLYILAKQNFRLSRLNDKVDVAITDSPIILSAFYKDKHEFKNFKPFIFELFESYDNINFFVNRVKPYNPVGRFQTEEESDEISSSLKSMLLDEGISYIDINGSVESYDDITRIVLEALNKYD